MAQVDAGSLQKLKQRRMGEVRRQLHRRNVAAARERIARANRPEKFPIEIFRIVITKTSRRIGQDRQWVNQSLLERESVNKRLQGRTGRPRTARSVDLAVDVDLIEIGGANLREHVHCPRVDQHCGGIFDSAIATPGNVIGDSSLDRLLLLQVERGYDFFATVRLLQDLLNEMRREKFSVAFHPRPELASGKSTC